jgi:hypothetical protein
LTRRKGITTCVEKKERKQHLLQSSFVLGLLVSVQALEEEVKKKQHSN